MARRSPARTPRGGTTSAREPWALPEEVVGPGAPWHVRGSLLGLERPLARPLAPRPRRRRPAGSAARARRRAAPGPRGPRGARQPPRPDRRRPRRDLRGDRGRPGPRGGPARGGRGRWRRRAARPASTPGGRGPSSGCSSTSRTPGGASSRSGSCCHLGAPGERRFDAWGVVRRSRRGPRPAHARPRPAGRDVRAPAAAGARGGASWTWSFAWRSTSPSGACRRASTPGSSSTLLPDLFAEARPVAPDDRLGLDAWVRAQGRERLDDAVASLVGRGPLQPAAAPGGAR